MESLKRNPYIDSGLIFDNSAEKIKWKRTAFQEIDQKSKCNN